MLVTRACVFLCVLQSRWHITLEPWATETRSLEDEAKRFLTYITTPQVSRHCVNSCWCFKYRRLNCCFNTFDATAMDQYCRFSQSKQLQYCSFASFWCWYLLDSSVFCVSIYTIKWHSTLNLHDSSWLSANINQMLHEMHKYGIKEVVWWPIIGVLETTGRSSYCWSFTFALAREGLSWFTAQTLLHCPSNRQSSLLVISEMLWGVSLFLVVVNDCKSINRRYGGAGNASVTQRHVCCCVSQSITLHVTNVVHKAEGKTPRVLL